MLESTLLRGTARSWRYPKPAKTIGSTGVTDAYRSFPARPGLPGWKRILDVVCILLALPVLVPTSCVIALLIFCVSRGPVLYLQERVGYRGRRFICFKFRTMKVQADAESHRRHTLALMRSSQPMHKLDGRDPRLIPLGVILRASGLDELPQLLNVLAGQMSLVGPRPCLPYEYEHYGPEQKERFHALPGLTGLWQVSGKNRTTFLEMIELDRRYVRAQSPWLDLKILLLTVPVMLGQLLEMGKQRQDLLAEQRMLRNTRSFSPRAARIVRRHPWIDALAGMDRRATR